MTTKKITRKGINISDFANRKIRKVENAPINPEPTTPKTSPKAIKPTLQKPKVVKKTKTPTKQIKRLETSETPTVHNPAVYSAFIDWMSLPSNERQPSTQRDFAKLYHIDEDTLTNWKKRPGFWGEMQKRMKNSFKEKLPLATQALFMRLLKTGNAKEFMAFIQYVAGYNPKLVIEDETPAARRYDPAVMGQFTNAMKNVGFNNLQIENEKLAEAFRAMGGTTEDEDEE